MKTAILAVTTLAVVGAGMNNAAAGDREWATAGKILTGVVAGTVLARALDPAPCTTVTYTYAAPPVYVQPAPVVVAQPVYAPQPVVVQAPPPPPPAPAPAPTVVYVQPAPVYVAPTTACVVPAPVYVAPRPIVYVGFGCRPWPVRHHHRGW